MDPLTRDTARALLRQLIAMPSVNPSIADEGHNEAAVARLAAEWLASQGVRAWTDEVAPGRLNAVAEAGNANGPTIVFCAHLDTVGTAGMTIPPFAGEERDGRVYGRGAYDMKGSVAALMCAAAALARQALGGRVLVSLVCDEEYASIGAQDFVRRYPADACVVTEPSEGKLILGHKGFVWAEIVTTGRAAHGSRWDLGVSAIGKMGRIIEAIERFDQEQLRRRAHPLLGPASQHCAMIGGGAGLSTYSALCKMQIERRTLPGETPEQVLSELRQMVRDAGEDAQITLMLARPPLTCDRHEPIAVCVRDAAACVTGQAPDEAGVGYWMDAALFAAAGIPTVNYGPAGAGAHEAVEWVSLDSVVTCAKVLAETARSFFRRSGGSR